MRARRKHDGKCGRPQVPKPVAITNFETIIACLDQLIDRAKAGDYEAFHSICRLRMAAYAFTPVSAEQAQLSEIGKRRIDQAINRRLDPHGRCDGIGHGGQLDCRVYLLQCVRSANYLCELSQQGDSYAAFQLAALVSIAERLALGTGVEVNIPFAEKSSSGSTEAAAPASTLSSPTSSPDPPSKPPHAWREPQLDDPVTRYYNIIVEAIDLLYPRAKEGDLEYLDRLERIAKLALELGAAPESS